MKDAHQIVRITGGRIALTNTSPIPDAEVIDAIRFVARQVDMDGVVVHVKKCGERRRTYGRAYPSIPRIANMQGLKRVQWRYLIVVTDGRGKNWIETLAHEAKHVEQYRERLRRSEVACRVFQKRIATAWFAEQTT